MRIRLLIAAAALAALAAPSAASADAVGAAAKKRTCVAKGSKTVAKNRYARVFTVPGRADRDEVARLYGCMHSVNRRVRLDTATDDGYVSSQSFNAAKLNGKFVAWQHTSADISCKADCPPGYSGVYAELRVANLRTKRVRSFVGSLGEGDALVVTRRGAIAWIEPGFPVSVRAADSGGERVLYAGDDIDGGSLELRGSTVTWVAGGAARSATLR